MDPVAAKMIGAGIACIGMGGAGVGVGIIFGNYLAGAMRNPSAAAGQFTNLLIGFALTEFTGLLGFVVSLGALGFGGILGAVAPLAMAVALTALEFLVAFLQAYVFAILTCIYLNDALHPGH